MKTRTTRSLKAEKTRTYNALVAYAMNPGLGTQADFDRLARKLTEINAELVARGEGPGAA